MVENNAVEIGIMVDLFVGIEVVEKSEVIIDVVCCLLMLAHAKPRLPIFSH